MPVSRTPLCLVVLPVLLGALAARPLPAQAIHESRQRVDSLRLLARRDSCDPALAYTLGIALLSRDQFDAADSAFQRAVRQDPQMAPAWLALGVVQDQHRGYWNALRRDPAALDRERQRRRGWLSRAFLIDPFVDIRLLYQGSDTEAWNYYDRLTRAAATASGILDSVPPGLLWLHTLLSVRTQRYQDAVGDAEALLRVSVARESRGLLNDVPLRTNEFRYMLAALHQRNGNGREAARLYREVLSNDVGNYMAHTQLARLFEADSNWAGALRERQAATDANPDDHTLLTDLAVTLARVDQWPAAEAALVRANQLSPCDSRVLYRLGIAQQHIGKTAEARRSFESFLELAPRGAVTPREDVRRRLALLP